MSAKELCAKLMTRAIKSLSDEEEEIVVDYLEKKLKVKTKLNMKPQQLCTLLLEKTIEQELGKDKVGKVPITAYANTLLGKEQVAAVERKKARQEAEESEFRKQQLVEINMRRKLALEKLENESKRLPGCIASDEDIFLPEYNIIVDNAIGISPLPDGTSVYSAQVAVPQSLYDRVFANNDDPILEFRNGKHRAYARISAPHEFEADIIYVSPLVGLQLMIEEVGNSNVNLCISLPRIGKAKFLYYGFKKDLINMLPTLIEKLPYVINAFSYLYLGMILVTNVEGKEIKIRVDGLYDEENSPIFAGLLQSTDADLPFEIDAELE